MNLDNLEESDILKLSLSELSQLPVPDRIHRLFNQLRCELLEKDILFSPHFWFSSEWFCPDGVAGMALPFYLLHPKLAKIEKKYIGLIEGISDEDFLKLARHEMGHVVDNVFKLRRLKNRTKIFGNISTPYPTSYFPNKNPKDFVKHLPDDYAQAHPEEDWAETFAVWLDPKSNWQKKYKNTNAYLKLSFIEEAFKNLKNSVPSSLKRSKFQDFSKDNRTLKEYLKQKMLERKVNRKPFFKEIKTNKHGKYLDKIILKNKKLIVAEVKKQKQIPQNILSPMLNTLVFESKNKLVSTNDDQLIKNLTKVIIKQENRFKKQGRHRIIM